MTATTATGQPAKRREAKAKMEQLFKSELSLIAETILRQSFSSTQVWITPFIFHWEGPVFCVALDPTGTIAVTGGEDDAAFVWRVDTGAKMFECRGMPLLCHVTGLEFKDSVTAVAFNFDGTLLATASMDGAVMYAPMPQDYNIFCRASHLSASGRVQQALSCPAWIAATTWRCVCCGSHLTASSLTGIRPQTSSLLVPGRAV